MKILNRTTVSIIVCLLWLISMKAMNRVDIIRVKLVINVLAGLLMAISAQAVVRVWDGGGDGVTWTDPANWNPDGTTGTSDILTVGSGAAVTNGKNTFASLDIQAGASVEFMEDLTGGRTLSVAGTLKKAGGVLRLNGATINLAGHLGSAITFLDTNGGAINFTDGATFDNPNMNFEHKGNNTFSFKLAAGGFKTLAAGTLYSGNNGVFSAAWSNVTYNVDIADYDLRSGLRIVLMDFTAHQTKFNTDFNTAKVNITAGDSGLEAALSFETATSSLVLTFPYPVTWSGDNGENWRNALNWIPTNLPTASDTVLIKSGGSVTNAQNVFASIEIQTNATVKVGVDFFGGIGRTNSVAGILDKDKAGTLRLNGGTLELFGALGSNITWLDTQGGAINFTDGAAFRNGNMNFQHKGSNIFGYKLSETGFTTLIAGKLWTGDNQEGWSKVTYNVDISDYAGAMPAEIVLADYAGHTAEYNQPFDPEQSRPKVNITGLHGGSLSFDTATSKLILRVYGPKGTLILVH